MPNSQNRNAGSNKISVGQPKDRTAKAAALKPNPERSDLKHDDGNEHRGSTDRTSNQGRKSASGGSPNE